jgi:hypothetical protein
MGDDRHSKSTAELDRGELAKLAIRSVRAPTDPGEPAKAITPDDDAITIARDPKAVLDDLARTEPTVAADDDAITIARDPKAVLDDVARTEPEQPAMLHEEVASSSLIAQALAQLQAGGPGEELRVRRPIVQTTEISPIEELASLGRGTSMTIPASPNRLAEIASSAPSVSGAGITTTFPAKASRAIEMKPIERPLAEARPIETSLAVGTKPLEMPIPEHVASGSPRADSDARPVAPRTEISLLIVAIVVILALAATIAGFVLSR